MATNQLRRTVLVIEDEFDVRESVKDLLESSGYEVSVAADGREGLRLALELSPDLILCDMMMPELDGLEVVSQLRSQEVGLRPPVLFLTGRTDEESVAAGLASGADDYLTKPFSKVRLLQAVEARLRRQEQTARFHDARSNSVARQLSSLLPSDILEPLEAVDRCTATMRSVRSPLPPEAIATIGSQIARLIWRARKRLENYTLLLESSAAGGAPPAAAKTPLDATLAAAIIGDVAAEIASLAERRTDLSIDLTGLHTTLPAAVLHKAVLEIVDNAFTFSSPGQVVEIRVTPDPARMVVRDSGPGPAEPLSQTACLDIWRRSVVERNLAGRRLGLAACTYLLSSAGASIHFRTQDLGLEVAFDLLPA